MAYINDRLGLATLQLGNFAANAAIGTAATTVDIASSINVGQTTAGITLTIPNPTVVTGGYMLRVNNTGSVGFTVLGVLVYGDRFIDLVWDGNSWNVAAGGGTVRSYNVVQNLVAGANVIAHNLNLVTPFATIMDVHDNTTGEELSLRATLETANNLTITVPVAYTTARITIQG